MDSFGNIWISDATCCVIRKILYDSAGCVTIAAGCPGRCGYRDGIASNALFDYPRGIATNPVTGVLHVADNKNNCIRAVRACGNAFSVIFV